MADAAAAGNYSLWINAPLTLARRVTTFYDKNPDIPDAANGSSLDDGLSFEEFFYGLQSDYDAPPPPAGSYPRPLIIST